MLRRAFGIVLMSSVVVAGLASSAWSRDLVVRYYQPPTGRVLLGFEGHTNGDGIRVDSVWYGGAAARAGIERGDVIVRVNGERIYSWSDYRGAVHGGTNYLRLIDGRSGRLVNVRVYADGDDDYGYGVGSRAPRR